MMTLIMWACFVGAPSAQGLEASESLASDRDQVCAAFFSYWNTPAALNGYPPVSQLVCAPIEQPPICQ